MWEEKSDTMRSRMVSYFIRLAMYFNRVKLDLSAEINLGYEFQVGRSEKQD
jgi:hypothetical protein